MISVKDFTISGQGLNAVGRFVGKVKSPYGLLPHTPLIVFTERTGHH